MYNAIAFFPNLNALRFFAALLVLFHHAEIIRAKNNFVAYADFSFFHNGTTAVKFFFVLSGFLITYLLLKEKKQTQSIHIGSFYLKRVIRIWPLYFLLVGIGTLLFPFLFQTLHIDYTFPYTWNESWYYFLLFIPSLVTLKYGSHLLEPLWSIGVEEWFYLLWAPLFKWIKKPLVFIIGILILKIGLLLGVKYQLIQQEYAVHFITNYSFESMAFGALGAYFLFHSKTDIKSLYHKYWYLNMASILLLCIFIFFNQSLGQIVPFTFFHTWEFNWIVLNLLFLNLILYVSLVLSADSWLNKKWLDLGGRISYGIYMYHMLVIFTVVHFTKKHLINLPPVWSMLLFYTLVIGGTCLTAYLSKKYFEDWFMRFRKKLP